MTVASWNGGTTLTYNWATATDTTVPYHSPAWGGAVAHVSAPSAFDELEKLRAEIEALKNKPEFFKVEECPSCGGEVEMKAEDMILKCKYCKRVMYIGTKHLLSRSTNWTAMMDGKDGNDG